MNVHVHTILPKVIVLSWQDQYTKVVYERGELFWSFTNSKTTIKVTPVYTKKYLDPPAPLPVSQYMLQWCYGDIWKIMPNLSLLPLLI